MVQALLLMAMYGFLPFVLVFSRYDISMMIGGAVVFLTIRFWNVLWAWAEWIDSNLYEVMYPDSGMLDLGNGASQLILDMVSTGLYVIFPLVFTAIMGWFGVKAGEHVGNLMKESVSDSGGMGGAGKLKNPDINLPKKPKS